MDTLPDDVLLRVFRLLEVEQLVVEVRAVCRRWRGLAVHPDVWSGRTVSTASLMHLSDGGRERGARLLERILLLAPCLHKLEYDCSVCCCVEDDNRSVKAAEARCATTQCAASGLYITVSRHEHCLAAEVLRNQVRRGRLHALEVNVYEAGPELRGVLDVVKDLHLTHLLVRVCDEEQLASYFESHAASPWGEGSIPEVTFDLEDWGRSAPPLLMSFLLRARAASLRAVHIDSRGRVHAQTIHRLAECRHLLSLLIRGLPEEVDRLRGLPLTALQLHLEEETCIYSEKMDEPTREAMFSSMRSYFSSEGAARLSSLTLSTSEGRDYGLLAVDLVRALAAASGGAAVLQKLSVVLPTSAADDAVLDALGEAAVELSSLLFLELHPAPRPRLLEALLAGGLPRLRTLQLSGRSLRGSGPHFSLLDARCWLLLVRLAQERAPLLIKVYAGHSREWLHLSTGSPSGPGNQTVNMLMK